MGNGVIENILILFMWNLKNSEMHTGDMAEEIARLNEKMRFRKPALCSYGPGRWGTRIDFLEYRLYGLRYQMQRSLLK
jgi:hypothetical protein